MNWAYILLLGHRADCDGLSMEVSTKVCTFRLLSFSLQVKHRIPRQPRHCGQEEGSLSRLFGRLYGLVALLHTEFPHHCRTSPHRLPEHATAMRTAL